jgi:hypothetical protein
MGGTKTSAQSARWVSAATLVAAVAAASAAEALTPEGPKVLTTIIFVCLVILSANLGLKFPTRVTISPVVIMALAAVVAFGFHGEVVGSLLVGASGAVVLKAFQARRWTAISYNMGQMALSAGAIWPML